MVGGECFPRTPAKRGDKKRTQQVRDALLPALVPCPGPSNYTAATSQRVSSLLKRQSPFPTSLDVSASIHPLGRSHPAGPDVRWGRILGYWLNISATKMGQGSILSCPRSQGDKGKDLLTPLLHQKPHYFHYPASSPSFLGVARVVSMPGHYEWKKWPGHESEHKDLDPCLDAPSGSEGFPSPSVLGLVSVLLLKCLLVIMDLLYCVTLSMLCVSQAPLFLWY